MKNLKRKHIFALVTAVLAAVYCFCSLAVSASAVLNGGNGYINFRKFCVEGASGISETSDGAYIYTKLSGVDTYLRMMYLSDTNTGVPRVDAGGTPVFAYCIEFGQEVNSNYERTAYIPENSEYWNALGVDRKQGIALAALYGYPVNSFGVSAADAYAATQAVIWEFQTGVRFSLSKNERRAAAYEGKTIEADRFVNMLKNENGTDRAAMAAYNALTEKIYKHNLSPDFGESSPTLTFDVSSRLYTKTLTDKNGVLSDYTVTADNPALSAIVSGNTLTLSSKEELPQVKLRFERKTPKVTAQPLLVLKAASPGQVTVVGQSAMPISSSLTVSVEPLIIPQYKIGVLKEGEVLTGFTEQTVINTAKPENGGSDSELLLNTPVYEKKYLSDCKVGVYAAEDIITVDGELRLKEGELADTLITSEDGAVYTCDLYEGRYVIKELEAPYGYVGNHSSADLVGESEPEQGESPQAESEKAVQGEVLVELYGKDLVTDSAGKPCDPIVSIYNERIKPELKFTKVLEGTDAHMMTDELYAEKLLQGVSFGVYTAEDILDLPANSLVDIIYPQASPNSSASSNSSTSPNSNQGSNSSDGRQKGVIGVCTGTADLPYGFDYYVRELTTADGYILSDERYNFTELSGQTVVNEKEPPVIIIEETPLVPAVPPLTETPTQPLTEQPKTEDTQRSALPSVCFMLISASGIAVIQKRALSR